MKFYDNLMKKVVCTALLILVSLFAVSVGLGWVSTPSDVGVVGGVCLLLTTVVAWYYYVTRYLLKGGSEMGKKNSHDFKNFLLIGVLFFVMSNTSGCSTVGPGYAGIKVNYYGSDRGVQTYPIVTGRVWYNPISETVLDYPTFVQTAVWTASAHEGSPNNEEISFNSKEGLVINGDISLLSA